jgi:uncharacterized Zn-binding protein involved in type VI secretion
MGRPAARQGDKVIGVDLHLVVVPGVGPVSLPHPFSGTITSATVSSVTIAGAPAATVGSVATNSPAHIPTPPGTSFVRPPANRGEVSVGSTSVTIGGKAAARLGDPVRTCNDPADADTSAITSGVTTVTIG